MTAAAIEQLFVDLFLEAHSQTPQQIILDLDATDDPLHGHQEGRFFHGYYDCYCYLPLYVFCGQHLLAAKLRPANIDGGGRRNRGDGPHCRPDPRALAARCVSCCAPIRALHARPDGVVREQRSRLSVRPGPQHPAGRRDRRPNCTARRAELRRAAQPARRFKDFIWTTRNSWSRERRVVAKAEWTGGEANPRFVVTSLSREGRGPASLREALLRPRRNGKPHQGVPARPLRRPHFVAHDACQPAAAVVRLDGLCAGLRAASHRPGATQFARATCGTIRLKLFKIGALVRTSVRRIKLAMPSAFAYQAEYRAAHAALIASSH